MSTEKDYEENEDIEAMDPLLEAESSFSGEEALDEDARQTGRWFANRFADLRENFAEGLANNAFRWAAKTSEVPWRVGKALFGTPERRNLMREAGASLRDLREVAGLTVRELSDALDLEDSSLIEAVESGTATLSFELILRLSSLLARHDPVPFIVRYTRTYNPTVWRMLEGWGVGRLPLQFERERQFINIYRRHDAARDLSDEDFTKVLQFTQSAFEMALHFVAQETMDDEEDESDEDEHEFSDD